MMKDKTQYIYGKHTVNEALRERPDIVVSVLYIDGVCDDVQVHAKSAGIKTSIIPIEKLPHTIPAHAVHQNVIAEINMSLLIQSYKSFIDTVTVSPDTGLVLVGEVQDPHNVGAVIRSAAAFGVSGVLIPEHNQSPVTAAVIKVSAGMAFRVPLISIGNVNTTIEDLKKKGFWIYGLAGEGDTSLSDELFEAPAVLVLGNESKGIREKTREHCDILLSIPMEEKCESLNASVSAGICMHTWYEKKKAQKR